MGKKATLLKYSLHLAVIAGIVWAGTKSIDGDSFQRALRGFDWRIAPLVAFLGLASVVIKSHRFAGMLRQATEVDQGTAIKAYLSGQAATLLPGGIAARAGLLKQAGVPISHSSPAIAMSSIVDQLGFLACGIVASLWFQQARKPVMILLAALAAISLVLGIEASRTWLFRIIHRLLGKFNLARKWQEFSKAMSRMLTARTIGMGILNTLASFACLVFALSLCMVGVGRPIPVLVALLAFAIPTMLGRISALPGGFGLTEVGMVGVLDHAPGVRLDEAAAAVLVFRLGTVAFSAFCGGIVYFTMWRGHHIPSETAGKEAAA